MNLNIKENIKFIYDIFERYLLLISKLYNYLANLNYTVFDTFTHQICKQEKYSFNISSCLKIKENKFYLLSETEDTYIFEIMNLKGENTFLNFDEINLREIKLNFNLQKVYSPNNDCFLSIMANYELYFHSRKNRIKVSFFDSVEELTELSNIDIVYKFCIIYINIFYKENIEYLLVIYKVNFY